MKCEHKDVRLAGRTRLRCIECGKWMEPEQPFWIRFWRALGVMSVILLLMSAPAFAVDFDVQGEAGLGFGKSNGSEVALLRYQVKSEPFLGFYSYNEALLMSWNGDAHASAVGFAKTICFKKYYTFSAGGLLIDKGHTENLGTPLEFYFRLAYDITPKIAVGLIHISNGKLIFGWNDNHNNGENFLTVSAVLF